MSMSRKDYVKFANILAGEAALAKSVSNPATLTVLRNLTLSMADVFAQDNPNFDRERFYVASGMRG